MFAFIFNSILLGVGLAMDAFSVSLANGLNDSRMRLRKMCLVAGTFAFFQALMPLIGWFCVHNLSRLFTQVQKFVPLCALILLVLIGSKMLIEAIKDMNGQKTVGESTCCDTKELTVASLIVQGIATSIDALSVGFTIAEYDTLHAIFAALIIAVITFIICMAGIEIGKRFGTKLACKASVLGGCILIFIGIEIFITSLF
ncbi:MAG: manganese efflux pump [Clostridia bacterium]|nr:manganese efflux pump [Clostridia bacterium]